MEVYASGWRVKDLMEFLTCKKTPPARTLQYAYGPMADLVGGGFLQVRYAPVGFEVLG